MVLSRSEIQHRYYLKNKEKLLSNPKRAEWSHGYYLRNKADILARNKAYRNSDVGKAARKREYVDPIKAKCRQRLNDAVEAGKINRKPCEVCGETPSEGHHDDYSIWHKVRWLCNKHHVLHHKTLSSSANLEGAKGVKR